MNENLDVAMLWEKERSRYEINLKHSTLFRDKNIKIAFDTGCRQKEIANAVGLSESRVKKIISELKNRRAKNEQETA